MGDRPEPVRFDLPAALVRDGLAALRTALLDALPPAGALVVDGSNVLEVDGPGVQLLLSLVKSARDRGVAVTVVNRSQTLQRALATMHVADSFE